MVAVVDWAVGKLLDTLDRLQRSENTLVILTSDNGPRIGLNGHESAGDWRGYKSHAWEGGHRIPFMARWPGRIPPASTSDEPVSLSDFLATCAAIVGAELPEDAGEDSHDILPALLGEKPEQPIREAVVSHSVRGAFTIRKGDWKLILGTKGSGGWVPPSDDTDPEGNPTGQLYNLAADPAERQDLFDARPEIVRELSTLLERYKAEGRNSPSRGRPSSP